MNPYRYNSTFELTDGRQVPVLAEVPGHDYTAYVLAVDADPAGGEYWVHWTDGINWWCETFDRRDLAFAYLAALVHAVERDEFLVERAQVDLLAARFVAESVRR